MSKKNSQSKIVNRKSPMVWRIFHFEERFELPENIRKCRRSALEFTRDFVGDAGGDEAVGYQRQFALLANGNGLEFAQMYGIYRLLVNMSAKQSKAYRGYLLDAKNEPLTFAQIAKLLNIKTEQLKRFFKKLESVDLLEYVPLPKFDLSRNEDSKSEQKQGKSGGGRRRAENSARGRKALKNGKRRNDGNKVNEQKATNGLTAVDKDKNKNVKAHKHQAKAQGKGQSKGQDKDEPPSAPSTAPPLKPRESDALGGSKVIPFTAGPPSSVKPDSGRQRPSKPITAKSYNKYDEQVGTRIYIALGFKWDLESPQARREICSFAGKFAEARSRLSGLPPPVIDELARRAIDEAKKLSRKGRRNVRPGAVLNTIIDKLVTARLRDAM